MDDPAELRRLAAWYRGFAAVGAADRREERLRLAEYLERRAKEIEKQKPSEARQLSLPQNGGWS